MSNQHVLKIHPAPLADLLSGAKTAEVRRNDRGFQVGDTVRLMEVNPETGNWTGAADQFCTITHIQTGYGLPDDICVLSYGKVGQDYKAHWMGFMDRTDWMQEKGQVPAKYLGQHRADILTDMLREAREALVRAEAERDSLCQLSIERGQQRDAAQVEVNELRRERDTAQAELAEALGEIRIYQQKFRYIAEGGSFYLSTAAECVRLTSSFLAMHANTDQAKQQEAQSPMAKIAEGLRQKATDEWANHPSNHSRQEAQGAQAGEFQREDRYIVIKRKDLDAAPPADRERFNSALLMLTLNLRMRECLVIESDWPEYETTWASIQARVEGRAALATQPAVRGSEHE